MRPLTGVGVGRVESGRPQGCAPNVLSTQARIIALPSVGSKSVDGEAIEKAGTAGAFQIGLAAALSGVRRIPGGAIADSIGMADLRGTRGTARPVVARVVDAIGVGAAVPFRSGKNFVLNRLRMADSVNHLPMLGAG